MKLLNVIGASLLLTTAAGLSLTGVPTKMTPIKITEEIGSEVIYGDDTISPLQLTDWLMADLPDLFVVDIRDNADYLQFHIDESVNIPFPTLMSKEGMYQLPKRDRIVLVCGDGVKAAKAWVVLRSKGYETYSLDGGITAWVDDVLTPQDGATITEKGYNSRLLSAKVNALREHYLGGGKGALSTAPPVEETAPAPALQPKGNKKKKSGGC